MASSLTLVVPTYQERDNIEPFLRRLFRHVPDAGVLVVDDGSPDGTAAAVRALARELPGLRLLERRRKEGLGRAYVAGFTHLLGNGTPGIIGMMDADFSHDAAALPEMIAAARECEFVVGSRYVAGGSIDGWERWRHALSTWGNRYSQAVTGMPVSDATSGFNLIQAECLRGLPLEELRSSGYAFQIELKYRLWKRGARLREVPITFHERRGGESKITNHIIYEGVIAPWRLRFSRH